MSDINFDGMPYVTVFGEEPWATVDNSGRVTKFNLAAARARLASGAGVGGVERAIAALVVYAYEEGREDMRVECEDW